MSRTPARHQKPPLSTRPSSARPGAHGGRHRQHRPSHAAAAPAHKPTRIAAAVAGSTLLAAAAVTPVLLHWAGSAPHGTALDQDGGGGTGTVGHPGTLDGTAAGQPDTHRAGSANLPVGASGVHRASIRPTPSQTRVPVRAAVPRPRRARHAAPTSAYQNPLRGISGLLPERVDMGVDFGGSGPIYALGDAVITNATGSSGGWPGGGWITYKLTAGPQAGLMVYVAEDVRPDVQVGQSVTSATVIATMFDGGDGIETGWAQPDGSSALSQLPEAGGISGGGPFPTEVGLSFEQVLQNVGVPAAPNRGDSPSGTLPPGYPAAG